MISAYKYQSDLFELRRLFYEDATPESLSLAVAKVELLHARGKLPHGVDSTSLIVSAQLQDQTAQNAFALRCAYSMALVRFVNGTLDPYQQGGVAAALLTLAKSIGLPHSFVELRHAATHELLPLLVILRRLADRALVWLYENYWAALERERKRTPIVTAHVTLCATLLKQYKSSRKLGSVEARPSVEDMVVRIVQMPATRSAELLTTLLLAKHMMAPKPFGSLQLLYKPLLEGLPPSFVTKVVFALITGTYDADLAQLWLRMLIPQLLGGMFPFLLHQTFESRADLEVALKNGLTLLDRDSVVAATVNEVLTGQTKKVFALPPLLDDLLELSTEPERPESRLQKRQRTDSFFEAHQQWIPRPFGIAGGRRDNRR